MSATDELAKLADLHERDAITDEEYAQAKARLLRGLGCCDAAAPMPITSMRRSVQDRWLAGVCGGLGAYTGVPSWAWRLCFVCSILFAGTGVLVYLLLWMFIPRETV